MLSHDGLLAWWPPVYVTSSFLDGSKHVVSDSLVSGVFQVEKLLLFGISSSWWGVIKQRGRGLFTLDVTTSTGAC